jgi:hypothetical protein
MGIVHLMKWPLFLLPILHPLIAWGVEPSLSFNRDIRPILSENCFYCHGQDPNHRKGNLRLDMRESATTPAESGEVAVVPGKPGDSALIQRVLSDDRDEQMPPPKSHRVLTAEQKKKLQKWIADGAPYEAHWTFITPIRPELPKVHRVDWTLNPIDGFVLAKLEQEQLQPSPEADRATLIRRVTLDLVGLPPTPEEVDAFIGDTEPGAYERVVDGLLASPHYGERMALPWLDAARYADSNGFQQDGDTFQWLWRDWVVRALNADMPFDQFSIEQLAGDLLPNPTNDQLIATAFNRNHLLNGEGGAIPEEQRFNNLFDRVDTTSTTWLALTVACAQCHDHKYDPITQRDYYSLLHIFNHLSENGLAGGGPGPKRIASPFLELPSEENKQHLAELEARIKDAEKTGQVKEKQDLAFAAWTAGLTPDSTFPDGKPLPGNLTAIMRIDVKARTAEQTKELNQGMRAQFDRKVWPEIAKKDSATRKAEEIRGALTKYKNEEVPRVMVMRDDRKRDTFVLDRGEYLKPKDKVGFSTPAFLPAPAADSPQDRLGFARWLFTPDHPLTARVQVNRMWQLFFGTGLVKTAEDLGVQSEMPVHQDLLDWLAVEFRESGWRMKHLHRLIVTSATYRQSSRVTPELHKRDPENRLMARGARFRAPSLILRDVALAASGLLERKIGGEPVYPYQPDAIWETLAITKERDFTYPASSGADLYRRSLYTFWRRTIGPANMFDASNRQTCKVTSSITSTPLHALTTLNDPTWAEAARVLAARAMENASETDAQLTYAFRRVLARVPAEKDLAILRRALDRQLQLYEADSKAAEEIVKVGAAPPAKDLPVTRHAALAAVCLGLFNLDESLTRP